MYDLVPPSQAVYYRWRGGLRPELQARLTLARALTSEKPTDALVALVGQGVERDVALQLARGVHRWPAPCSEPACAIADGAINELRRLSPPGVEAKLRPFLARYEPALTRLERASDRSAGARGRQGSSSPSRIAASPAAYLGTVGPRLAELVGDLGDRNAERTALGGPTLWDRVHEAEQEMIAKNLLSPAEVVATTR